MREDPFNGTWKLNVAASKLPFTPPQSVVLHIEADQDWVTLTENSIASEGGAETVTIRAQFNNQVYPVHGSGLVDSFTIRRVDACTWEKGGSKLARSFWPRPWSSLKTVGAFARTVKPPWLAVPALL